MSGKWRPFCLGLNVLKGDIFLNTQNIYPQLVIGS